MSKEKEVYRGGSAVGPVSCSDCSSSNSRGTVEVPQLHSETILCSSTVEHGAHYPASWVDFLGVVTFKQKGAEVCSAVGQRGQKF